MHVNITNFYLSATQIHTRLHMNVNVTLTSKSTLRSVISLIKVWLVISSHAALRYDPSRLKMVVQMSIIAMTHGLKGISRRSSALFWNKPGFKYCTQYSENPSEIVNRRIYQIKIQWSHTYFLQLLQINTVSDFKIKI